MSNQIDRSFRLGPLVRLGKFLSAGIALSVCAVASGQCDYQKLMDSYGAEDDLLGWSVGLSGDAIILGAMQDEEGGVKSGSACIFRLDDGVFTQESKLAPPDGATGDRFGISVGIDGDTAIVGSQYHDALGVGSGTAYLYEFDGTAWQENGEIQFAEGTDYLPLWRMLTYTTIPNSN